VTVLLSLQAYEPSGHTMSFLLLIVSGIFNSEQSSIVNERLGLSFKADAIVTFLAFTGAVCFFVLVKKFSF
jgi:hypothetical protein